MSTTIACIGSGNMGGALMKGAAKIIGGGNIGVTNRTPAKAETLAGELGGRVYASNTEAVEQADFVFLAVKPQVLQTVLEEIAPTVRKRNMAAQASTGHGPVVLVSMAAGWSIAKLQAALDGVALDATVSVPAAQAPIPSAPPVHVPLVRIMPNTPALIGQGVIAMAVSPELSAEKAAELEKILGAAGVVDRMEEKYFDAITGLSGSGPAFVYLFIEALADGGVRAGLPRDKALRYAAQTALGAAAMVKETGKHPGELKDMVTSPGGTTIAGVAALENGAFRGTVMNAVEAAFRRSIEMA
ncbi:pyrroline-5-carboxylate reductase [Spirochaetia bacterium]|nr:pyrroline-5-carboxylate reductase [Spirochaetia bacterium]